MLIALTALVGVLAASFNEFISMLPKFNKELTRKLLNCRRCCLFLICICRRSEYYSGWTRKSGYLHHGANDRAFRGNGERAFAGDDRSFMLFEVRHVPYKMRFALNNPQIHIAGLHRALKGVSHYLALKTLLSLWTGVIVWLGLELMGVQFALMWAVLAFLLNYVPNIGAVISAVPPMIQVLLFNGIYECILVGALF